VGAGLVCRADQDWNFVAFYTAPEEADEAVTFARFGVCQEGVLTTIAAAPEPIRLGTGYNRFSLEFFSDQLRGEIETEQGTCELRTRCVAMPFPGHAGLVRLYGAGLMATNVVVQHTTIPLAQEALPAPQPGGEFEFDVFLCHASEDKAVVRAMADVFQSRGITYWLDEKQIDYGEGAVAKIEEGLQRSRYAVPCVSANLAARGGPGRSTTPSSTPNCPATPSGPSSRWYSTSPTRRTCPCCCATSGARSTPTRRSSSIFCAFSSSAGGRDPRRLRCGATTGTGPPRSWSPGPGRR